MPTSILPQDQDRQELYHAISAFFNSFHIGNRLRRCNAQEEKGVPANSTLLASLKEQNILGVQKKYDGRPLAGRRREFALFPCELPLAGYNKDKKRRRNKEC